MEIWRYCYEYKIYKWIKFQLLKTYQDVDIDHNFIYFLKMVH